MTTHQKLKRDIAERPSDAVAFTTGAHILPQKLANGKWAWVVSCFEDSTYYDGSEVAVSENWTDERTELAGEEDDDE